MIKECQRFTYGMNRKNKLKAFSGFEVSQKKRKPIFRSSTWQFVFVLFLGFIFVPSCKKAQQLEIIVNVDPRVELHSIIFHLAGNPEYNQGRIPSYNEDVKKYFGNYKDHAAVELARKLRKTRGISYNAPMGLAVHVVDAFGLEEKVPFDPLPEGLDKRWTPKDARDFLDAARSFVKETNFRAFIDEHRELYDLAAQRMQKVLQEYRVVDWFNSFFGERPGASFVTSLGMLNGGPCYGARIKMQDGSEELYCILGVWMADSEGLPRFDKRVLSTVVHEFCHSYANPLVDKHEAELKESGEKIFPQVAKEMRRQAYSSWKTMMYESLVRGCVVRFISSIGGEEAAKKLIAREEQNRFLWMEGLSGLLEEYEAQRKKYPNLDSYFPHIVDFFNEYSKDVKAKVEEKIREIEEKERKAWEALKAKLEPKAPKIVSMIPPNGAQDVDPDLKFIKITFDRPMMDKMWAVMVVGDRPHFPKIVGSASYDSSRKVFTIPVELNPDWEYEFGLNSRTNLVFKDENKNPLLPVIVKFRTRKKH